MNVEAGSAAAPHGAGDDAAKALTALQRGVPATRMRDYGLDDADTAVLTALTVADPAWEDRADALAAEHVERAERLIAAGQNQRAAQALEWAGAVAGVGQLAFNHDVPRKVAQFGQSTRYYERSAGLAGIGYHRLRLQDADRPTLYGWRFPHHAARGCVIIAGGLSGWGAAYFGMARAFNARGLSVILAEAPGQGETRMVSGLYLSRASVAQLAPFIDAAVAESPRVGIMGNSFGGLIAAHAAAREPRIAACCINGAIPNCIVPDFRTAREQMEAAFGLEDQALEAAVADFAFDPAATPLRCPVLIVQGGADPLVPLDAQDGFLDATARDRATTLTWADGEHTIYNHAADRDASVAAWFVDQLNGGE
jgi:alpha-beta hydrolase superfamily lysophospholipase